MFGKWVLLYLKRLREDVTENYSSSTTSSLESGTLKAGPKHGVKESFILRELFAMRCEIL